MYTLFFSSVSSRKTNMNALAELNRRSRRRRRDFAKSGPRHLVKPDWMNPSHRRSIAASLVQAVYVLQKEPVLASSWWTFFNFHPTQLLLDQSDSFIFAAVFENPHAAQTGAPAAVVAFRGTIFGPDRFNTDWKVNLLLVTNGLHRTSRFEEGLEVVRSTVARHGHDNVWIAGHSTGAALAMAAGREICEREGFQLECHLFNPPFPSVPVEWIKNKNLEFGVHVAHSLVTAGLAKLRDEDANAFDALQKWTPNLYVNPRDGICSGYVGYFGNRERMQGLGLGSIADIAARHCVTEFLTSAFGKESKASHLIPSARLTVNLNPSSAFETGRCPFHRWSEFRKAHRIHQWWSPELRFRCTLFDRIGRNEVSEIKFDG